MSSQRGLLLICVLSLCSTGLVSGSAISESDADPTVKSSCPRGWIVATYINMSCLKFNTSSIMTWFEANIYCQQDEKAALVEVLTGEQMEFLSLQADMLDVMIGELHYWMGGSDLGREGQWYWNPSITEVGDFIWHDGEPDGEYDNNCMGFRPYPNDPDAVLTHEALAVPCTNKMYPICQREAT